MLINNILKWFSSLFKSKPKHIIKRGDLELVIHGNEVEIKEKQDKLLKHIFFFRKIQLLGKIIIHKKDRYRIVKSAGQILYDSAGGKLRNKYGYKMIQL